MTRPLFKWRDALLDDTTLGSTERLVALVLSLRMDMDDPKATGGAWLAHKAGLHVKTVQRTLNELVDAGWLTELEKGGSVHHGTRHASSYRAAHKQPRPGTHDDRSHTTTGNSPTADRESSVPRPGTDDSPFSKRSLEITRGAAQQPVQNPAALRAMVEHLAGRRATG